MVSIRVKVTVPSEKFADKKWVDEVVATMRRKTGPELKFEFQQTVNTWKNKPTFTIHQETQSNRILVDVYTFNDIYRLVNEGSPKHPIPRAPGFLRYRTGYASKSKAGSKHSFVGGKFGGWRVAKQVQHPGFEARKFDQLIAEDYNPKFQKDMQEAFNRVAKR